MFNQYLAHKRSYKKIVIKIVLFTLVVLLTVYCFTLIDKLGTNKSILSSLFNDESYEYPLKIIRYKCDVFCGGWADRLIGIMSAYAWSLIAGRDMQIDITFPCNIYHVLQPNEIDWFVNETTIKQEEILNSSTLHHWIKGVDNETIFPMFSSTDIREFQKETKIIIVKNNRDWMHMMAQNKHLENRIKELSFEPKDFRIYNVFRSWYNKLFKLAPDLQKRFEKFKTMAKPNGVNSKLICIQFREYYVRRNDSVRFWDFVKTKFINGLKNDENYRIFLTTDVPDVEDEALKIFGKDKLVRNEGIVTHMDRGDTTPDNCTRIERVILDFHSLQLCDMAVISNSGFGRLGLWNREKPFENSYWFSEVKNGEYEFLDFNQYLSDKTPF